MDQDGAAFGVLSVALSTSEQLHGQAAVPLEVDGALVVGLDRGRLSMVVVMVDCFSVQDIAWHSACDLHVYPAGLHSVQAFLVRDSLT